MERVVERTPLEWIEIIERADPSHRGMVALDSVFSGLKSRNYFSDRQRLEELPSFVREHRTANTSEVVEALYGIHYGLD